MVVQEGGADVEGRRATRVAPKMAPLVRMQRYAASFRCNDTRRPSDATTRGSLQHVGDVFLGYRQFSEFPRAAG